MARVDLRVPFSEKDRAKALGARWDAAAKTWYVPHGVDPAPFAPWMEAAEDGPSAEFNARAGRYFIVKALHTCWKCGRETSVFGFLLPPGHEELDMDDEDSANDVWVAVDYSAMPNYIDKLAPAVLSRMTALTPRYTRDFSKTTQDSYFMNHCEHCGMKQGDFNLYSEPGSGLLPITPEEAGRIELFEIQEEFACSGGMSMGDGADLIASHARRAK